MTDEELRREYARSDWRECGRFLVAVLGLAAAVIGAAWVIVNVVGCR